MKRTVGIIYGFGEGPGHSKRLRAALWARGFIVLDKAERADVIITHSGGNLLLPKDTAGKIIIMMNPSCSPMQQLPVVFTKKMLIEFKQSVKNRYITRWFGKATLNVWYSIAHTPHNLRMVAHIFKAPELLPAVDAARVWVVNARHDPWGLMVQRSETDRLPHYVFLTHGGSHDGLWLRPDICADIVQSAYGA